MTNKTLQERIPIFGEIEVNLRDESSNFFKIFIEDILNLREINQLGALHSFLNIPKYRRYDYIIAMLYLVEKSISSLSDSDSDFNFNSSINLLDDVTFRSTEELIKSWTLLYSLGHFQMTFTAEHAFIKYLISKGLKDEFITEIETRLQDSGWIRSQESATNKESKKAKKVLESDKRLLMSLKNIIENENQMELYKIFTILKISNKKNLNRSKRKLRELTKLMILKTDYSDFFSLEKGLKLKKIVSYFEIVRMLTFTILDGSISQKYLTLNYFTTFENLDLFMEKTDYHELLKSFNKFYTSDIYDSPESAYYHHRSALKIQELFEAYENLTDLINDLIDVKSGINNKIKEIIQDEEKIISDKIDLILKDSEDGFAKNKVYIKEELQEHLRVKVDREYITKPISTEIQAFKENKVFGGILYNNPSKCFEIDLYPNSELCEKEGLIFNVLKVLDSFYQEVISELLDYSSFHPIAKLYAESKKEEIKKYLSDDVVENLETMPIDEFYYYNFGIKFIKTLEILKGAADYLFSNIIKTKANFASLDLGSGNTLNFPIFFRGSELILLNSIIQEAKNFDKIELEQNLKLLEEELDSLKTKEKNIYYIYAPNTVFIGSKETEIDFLLIKLYLEEKRVELKIGEIKASEDSLSEDQCVRQLELIFNISKTAAVNLFRNLKPNSKELQIEFNAKKIKEDENGPIVALFEKKEEFIDKFE